jgi:hypothetical protein
MAIPHTGSIPSPAASQMSNMSNPNKSIKFIGGRDRGRKIKGLKISPGQHGSGNPWSLFEDQALVVLVHDMGPNWELISDAMNSTLKIKVSACCFEKSWDSFFGTFRTEWQSYNSIVFFFSILVNGCVGYCCPGYCFLVSVNNWYLLLAD